MIQSNELRLGNWVEAEGCPYQITHVSTGDEWVPITVAPEILEKAGFELNGDKNSQYYFKNGLRYHPGSKHLTILRGCDKAGESQAGCCGTSIGDAIIIKHLHQLQNLYFALTGEELNIQL